MPKVDTPISPRTPWRFFYAVTSGRLPEGAAGEEGGVAGAELVDEVGEVVGEVVSCPCAGIGDYYPAFAVGESFYEGVGR